MYDLFPFTVCSSFQQTCQKQKYSFKIFFIGNKEHSKQQYEVLVADVNARYQWIRSSGGQVPHGAIQGGRTSRGEPLYIGRKIHAGVMIPGKIHPSQGGLFIAYGGKEHAYQSDFEILVAMN